MSYLRFTPDEYRTIAELCQEHNLGSCNQPVFHRLLVQALRGTCPALATRLSRLGRSKRTILYWHFRTRTPAVRTRPQFTAHDLRLVAEACQTVPFRVRIVRPFKHVLVELFQDEWPDLAQKLARLSGRQFEQLYEQVVCEQRKDTA
jgi:hypothetical protein